MANKMDSGIREATNQVNASERLGAEGGINADGSAGIDVGDGLASGAGLAFASGCFCDLDERSVSTWGEIGSFLGNGVAGASVDSFSPASTVRASSSVGIALPMPN